MAAANSERDERPLFTGGRRENLPKGHCTECGAPPGYHYYASCVYGATTASGTPSLGGKR